MAGSQAPYIHIISYVVSIMRYYSAISELMLLWITNPSVSMTSFAQVLTEIIQYNS